MSFVFNVNWFNERFSSKSKVLDSIRGYAAVERSLQFKFLRERTLYFFQNPTVTFALFSLSARHRTLRLTAPKLWESRSKFCGRVNFETNRPPTAGRASPPPLGPGPWFLVYWNMFVMWFSNQVLIEMWKCIPQVCKKAKLSWIFPDFTLLYLTDIIGHLPIWSADYNRSFFAD